MDFCEPTSAHSKIVDSVISSNIHSRRSGFFWPGVKSMADDETCFKLVRKLHFHPGAVWNCRPFKLIAAILLRRKLTAHQ